MSKLPLVEYRFLDPRPRTAASAEPIRDAVNIPLAELAERMHELPAPDREILVVGPATLAAETVAWLGSRGRVARPQLAFDYAELPRTERGRLWRPNLLLEQLLPKLRAGRVLDLACGTGRDAVYLAAAGWQVTALDILPDALERGAALAEAYADCIAPIEWIQADATQELEFATRFDLVVGFRFFHREIFEHIVHWLRPRGHVFWEAFTSRHAQHHGRPRDAERVVRSNELPWMFHGNYHIRHYTENWRNQVHSARIWVTLR